MWSMACWLQGEVTGNVHMIHFNTIHLYAPNTTIPFSLVWNADYFQEKLRLFITETES